MRSAPQSFAKTICQTLFDAGYTAYIAGGWVRDLLLGQESDEIDIATSAPPYVIQKLFPKTIPVGIAFGVVIVVIEGINFEVTTFRKDHPYSDGRHPTGIDFSTAEKDAQRRDFTINGMFYDPLTETLHDYVGGKEDLHKGIIRTIGDPEERFSEDRLRMVRAVRFASRLGFTIDEATAKAITTYAPTLFPSVSIERIWQELCKMAAYPHFDQAILMLHHFGLLSAIFPQLRTTSLETIKKRVEPFPYFPMGAPPIAYLLELFPSLSLEERLQLCLYLKTSTQERKLVEFFTASQELFTRPSVEPVEWAHFYAHPLSELFTHIAAARLLPPHRAPFLEEHTQRFKSLKKHIERIQIKNPLITSAHLQQIGIPPGKKMGLFLKMAERIAINENLNLPEAVLQRLQDEISHL
jgi:poly(A) polymerase